MMLFKWSLFFTLGIPFSLVAAGPLDALKLPQGLSIAIFADGVATARGMTLGTDGTVYVGTQNEGVVYALNDRDGDGRAESRRIIAKGLEGPTGVAVIGSDLFVADMSQVLVFRNVSRAKGTEITPEVIFDGFPKDHMHAWKYLKAGPDGKLYSAIGVPCNSCKVEDALHGRLVRFNPDGSDFEVLATGIRNSVGFDWEPSRQELWFTDNGRDWLGDDRPPDELNHLVQTPTDFGFPRCYGKHVLDPVFGEPGDCEQSQAPEWEFPAHVAALGLHFYRGRLLPYQYQGQLFVAQHGSWNRSEPQGYRVVLVRFKDGHPIAEEPIVEGWLNASGKATGRPVDILELKDGSLLVSDDMAGVIYRITTQTN